MKGNISISDFINDVKKELTQSQKENAFFNLKEVNLEITFILDASADTKGNLFVVEAGGEMNASQTHKVTLKLDPTPHDVSFVGGVASTQFTK